MTSLHSIVLVRVTTLLSVVSLAAALTSYILVKREVNNFLDAQLGEVARSAGQGLQRNAQPTASPELEDRLVVQIWDISGRLVQASGPDADIPNQPGLGYFDVVAAGEKWRVYKASDSLRIVQISQRQSAREEIATQAAVGSILPFIAAIPLAWLLIGLSVSRVLRGLSQLSVEIGRRSTEEKEPLKLAGIPAEIVPLIRAMNLLIERHQNTLSLQRRFISDAAHELRTPLAALQLQIDNLQARNIPAGLSAIIADLGYGIRRGARLVGQLLAMARAESLPSTKRQSISVDYMIRRAIADFVPIINAKNLRLDVVLGNKTYVDGVPSDIESIFRILIENAVCYTDTGGTISIHVGKTAGSAAVEIVDSGCGIPDDALPFVFDRFFRAAPSDKEGTGLGLAIVKAIADREGLYLSIRNRGDTHGVIATITFPCRPEFGGGAPDSR